MFIVFIYIYTSLSLSLLLLRPRTSNRLPIPPAPTPVVGRQQPLEVWIIHGCSCSVRVPPVSEKRRYWVRFWFCWCIVLRETVCLSTFSLPSTTFKACFVEWVVDNLQFDFEILRKNHETSMRHDLHWLTSWSLSMISEVSSLDFIDFFVSENSHKVMQGMGFLRKRHDMVDWCGEGWYHLNICISPKSSYSEDFSPAVLKHHAEWGGGLIKKKEVVFHCVWSVAIPQRGSFGTTIHTALFGGIRKNRERDGMLRKTSIEPRQKNGLTFHFTGWLIGILIMGFL